MDERNPRQCVSLFMKHTYAYCVDILMLYVMHPFKRGQTVHGQGGLRWDICEALLDVNVHCIPGHKSDTFYKHGRYSLGIVVLFP